MIFSPNRFTFSSVMITKDDQNITIGQWDYITKYLLYIW